jgi:sugar phosphate isomerase/epimerase
MTWLLVCQESLIPGEGLVAKHAMARELGFDGLELRAAASRTGELQAAREAGVVMPTVCPEQDRFIADFDPERRREAISALKAQLSAIAAVGGHGVVTPAAWGMFSKRLPPFQPPRSAEQDHEALVDSLRQLGEHAAREGVHVLLEPLNGYEDHMLNRLDQAVELCRELGLDSLRVLADTYHMNIEEDDICAALRAAAPYLGAVHLSDSNRHQPGAGHLPFAAILATLRDAGFDGPLGLECRWRGDPAEALRMTGQFLRGLIDEASTTPTGST